VHDRGEPRVVANAVKNEEPHRREYKTEVAITRGLEQLKPAVVLAEGECYRREVEVRDVGPIGRFLELVTEFSCALRLPELSE
jgi:hypothetical protein